jgi:GH25 family lysozyme M1 (1,4-beta-N-acetylmuramidase)
MYTQTQLKNAPKLVDYSHWQGHVNGDKLKAGGIVGAIVKAGEVHMYLSGQPAVQDDMHDWNVGEIKRAGLLLGNYYYWHPKAGASKQYNHYWEISKDYVYDLPPIIDVEEFDGYTNTVKDKAEVSRQLEAMVNGVKDKFQRMPMIYTRQSIWFSNVGNPSWAADLLLWLAQYNTSMTLSEDILIDRVVMWQYTDRLAIPGLVTMDGNFWLKTEQELIDLTAHVIPTPAVYTKIEITCNFLRGRSRPIYTDSTRKVIFEKGQILNLVQPVVVVTESEVPFIEVYIPEAECTCWISSNTNYTRMIV